jgi:hypothetical protein
MHLPNQLFLEKSTISHLHESTQVCFRAFVHLRPTSDIDKASAAPWLGRGQRSNVGTAVWLLLCSPALSFHRGDGLTGLYVGDDRLMHETSSASDISGPIPQIGEVLTTA